MRAWRCGQGFVGVETNACELCVRACKRILHETSCSLACICCVHMARLANLLSCSLWRIVELRILLLGSEHCSAH